ncbi:MAG TPA: FtsX-like permease family protein, partial [Ktedonobacteraceae bacterium]|nr:FtsX-like permease family protein [Ktedonobacteraceae bacterium]
IIAGRSFSETDTDVVIISQRTAREYWKGGNPVGDAFWLEGEERPRQVIGIVGDTTATGLGEAPHLQIYLPYGHAYRGKIPALSTFLLARCGTGTTDCPSVLMQQITNAGGGSSVDRFAGLEDLVQASIAPSKAQAVLLGFYALLGLALAWLGVLALVSYLAAVRTYEMGVRMALGAQALDVVFALSSEGLWCAGVGLVVGLGASFAAVRVLASLLFGVKPLDPASFALAAFLLSSGVLLASVIPAFRVARREPRRLLQSC